MKIIITALLCSLMASTAWSEEYSFKPGDNVCTDTLKVPVQGRMIAYPTIEECNIARTKPRPQIKKLPNLGPGNWTSIGKLTDTAGGQRIILAKPPLKAENGRFLIWIAVNLLAAIPPQYKNAMEEANDRDEWDEKYPSARFMPMLYFIDCENMYGSLRAYVTPYVSADVYNTLSDNAENTTKQIIEDSPEMEVVEQQLLQSRRLSRLERSTIPGLLAHVICR